MILSDAESLQAPDALVRPCPLVLAGAGHAHLVMMRLWIKAGWQPPAGTVLISSGSEAWYSGMMPGLIAGRFELDECAIALLPICQRLGITLVQASVSAVDSQLQRVELDNGAHLHYQLLSINTGSQPVVVTRC
jgi:NADH dehydrogenase FAD-containing subunit